MGKPIIRFKGFTEEWEQRKLGELVGVYDGVHQTPEYQDEGIMFLSVENISTLKSEKYISKEAFERDYKVYPEKGDILMTRIGDVGTTNVVETSEKRAYYVSLALLKPNGIDSYFLSHAMKNYEFQKGLRERTLVTAIPQKINKDEIGKVPIFITVNIDEQTKIGGCFHHLDHLITLHQRKCDETKKLKKYMLQKMFPQNGMKVPEIRFEGFTGDWEQRKLGEIVSVCSGKDYKHLDEGNIPVYGTGGYMLSVSEALSNDSDAIGIGRKGTIDKPYILKAPFWTVDTLFYCIPHEKNDLSFVFSTFQNINWKAMDESTGVPSLSKTAINCVDVITPLFEEQKKIGCYFSNLDHLITLHQRKCDELVKIKKYMLQNMFV